MMSTNINIIYMYSIYRYTRKRVAKRDGEGERKKVKS